MPQRHNLILRTVQDSASLNPLLQALENKKILYADLEVDNMYHYFNQVSLMQILVDQTCYVVDFLAKVKIKDLLKALEGKTLVMHGADFDLRTLFQLHGFVPDGVFDTMLAARLLGWEEFGLSALVEKSFQAKLNKKFQKADWSLRPLPENMLLYAAQDTYFLPDLYQILRTELTEKKRLSWHREWCRQLISSSQRTKEVDPEELWRVKGSSRLTPIQLCVLKEIYNWREEEARLQNKPLFMILHNNSMVDLAASIVSPDQKLDQLPLKTSGRLKKPLLKIVKQALQSPAENWPVRVKGNRPRRHAVNPKTIEQLKSARDKVASSLGLPGSLLANKETLTQIAYKAPAAEKDLRESANLMKWQWDVLWDEWKGLSTITQ